MNRKTLQIFLGLITVPALANASVCSLEGGEGPNSDTVYSLICDGKPVTTPNNGTTGTLQTYLSNGYKIAGQSSDGNGYITYTLVK